MLPFFVFLLQKPDKSAEQIDVDQINTVLARIDDRILRKIARRHKAGAFRLGVQHCGMQLLDPFSADFIFGLIKLDLSDIFFLIFIHDQILAAVIRRLCHRHPLIAGAFKNGGRIAFKQYRSAVKLLKKHFRRLFRFQIFPIHTPFPVVLTVGKRSLIACLDQKSRT